MFQPVQITDGVYYVGVNDRRKLLFENQFPVPYGVSYNAYLICDEKVALVDTVDVGFSDLFLQKIESVIGNREIDYLIINHMEPDHSGSIRRIRERYPRIRIVANAKTFDMLDGYFGITDHLHEVKDSSMLELGRHRLRFALTPMVHWPETMMTFDLTDQILFSGDAFGTFGALNGALIDETLDITPFWNEMRRYYACIVGKYGVPVQNAMAKLKDMEIQYICTTHGPVWHGHIRHTLQLYDRWSRYEAAPGAVIAYGSMYGNTEQMAEAIAEGVVRGGIKEIVMYDTSHTDSSYILSDIFQYSGFIVGSPTYMGGILPQVESLLHKIEVRGVKNRTCAVFGSFTWAGMAIKKIMPAMEAMKWEIIGSVEEKQALKQGTYGDCIALGKALAEKIISQGTVIENTTLLP
ncbi:MAG: FprA family A-type flavoprotein [Bacteroidales bacterium]|jgi:flavorubredoxin|nr:FprA family A-type flavoprotein [Bacteroidales bacterium]